MIKVKDDKIYSNGLFDICEIYSDNGKKILEATNGQEWKKEDQPIVIAVSRLGEYVETDEPIEPITAQH